MKPAARGRNDMADRWEPRRERVESNDAPAGDERVRRRRDASTTGKRLSIRKAWPAPMI